MRYLLPALVLAGFLLLGCSGADPIFDSPLATPTLSFAQEQTPKEPQNITGFHSLPPELIDTGIEELEVRANAGGFVLEKQDFPQSVSTGQARLEVWQGVNDDGVWLYIEVGYDTITVQLSPPNGPSAQPFPSPAQR